MEIITVLHILANHLCVTSRTYGVNIIPHQYLEAVVFKTINSFSYAYPINSTYQTDSIMDFLFFVTMIVGGLSFSLHFSLADTMPREDTGEEQN